MKGISVFTLFMLGFFLLAINAGDMLYESDAQHTIQRDIYNYTNSIFEWNQSKSAPIIEVNNTYNSSVARVYRINNIVSKSVDWAGFSFMELGKLGVEIGYDGEGSYKMIGLLKTIKWILIFMLIYYLFLPVMAVVMFAWYAYDWVKKKVLRKK